MTTFRAYPAPARRRVIAEKRRPLRPVSVEGVRWDVLVITLGLALLVFLGVLFSDAEALLTGGERIGSLQAGIESLESTNFSLREKLSIARSHPVLVQKSLEKAQAEEPERVVLLSPPPEAE